MFLSDNRTLELSTLDAQYKQEVRNSMINHVLRELSNNGSDIEAAIQMLKWDSTENVDTPYFHSSMLKYPMVIEFLTPPKHVLHAFILYPKYTDIQTSLQRVNDNVNVGDETEHIKNSSADVLSLATVAALLDTPPKVCKFDSGFPFLCWIPPETILVLVFTKAEPTVELLCAFISPVLCGLRQSKACGYLKLGYPL